MDYILEEFNKLGYTIQEPTKDKTYFMVKQADKGTKMLWIKLKKTPEVECTFNYKRGNFTTREEELVAELAGNLGYAEYQVL